MGLLKNIVKGVGHVVTDAVKIGIQPIATAVNSVTNKDTISLSYDTKLFDKAAKVSKTVDSTINVAAKSFADKISGGYATKAANLLRSDNVKDSDGKYFEASKTPFSKLAVQVGAAYGEKVIADKEAAKAKPVATSGGLPLDNSVKSVAPVSTGLSQYGTTIKLSQSGPPMVLTAVPQNTSNMSLFSALGGLVQKAAPVIKDVIKNAQTQTKNPAASASGLAAPATVVGPVVDVNQQTTGNGVFSSVQGFTGGGSLQKKATVLPYVASGIAATGGNDSINLGGGYSINVPGAPGTNLPSNQGGGSSSMPVWLMPVAIGVGVVLLVFALFKK